MDSTNQLSKQRAPWRDRWNVIIFGHHTLAGRLFDLLLLILIVLSVLTVILDSVQSLHQAYGPYFQIAEWCFTALFTVEYIARLACATDAKRYACSFFGMVDFIAVVPVYLGIVSGITHTFTLARGLRLLRVFRILKLTQFMGEAIALKVASRQPLQDHCISVRSPHRGHTCRSDEVSNRRRAEWLNDFTSIPTAMYWAIVTVTTVGYGDISPHTVTGRIIASILMVLGYGIIAVPTGIVSFEFARTAGQLTRRRCEGCGFDLHDKDALHCKRCGVLLP